MREESALVLIIDHYTLFFVLFYSDSVHDETLGDDKVKERCLGVHGEMAPM